MRVFFACPLTGYLRGSRLEPSFQAFIVRVEQALIEAGHTVFLAHRVEDFGASLRPAELCTPLDMVEMDRADCVVAFPQSSYGVHVELGWAASMSKPILLVEQSGAEEKTPLLHGLASTTRLKRFEVPRDILSSEEAQWQLCERLVAALRHTAPAPPKRACAFFSTSFGFGPVSKAESIAIEVKRRAPQVQTHYFGVGVDYEFAVKSSAFDRVYSLDVDRSDVMAMLAPLLDRYEAVFSIMNHLILKHWRAVDVPLYLVDSLAWMWARPPRG